MADLAGEVSGRGKQRVNVEGRRAVIGQQRDKTTRCYGFAKNEARPISDARSSQSRCQQHLGTVGSQAQWSVDGDRPTIAVVHGPVARRNRAAEGEAGHSPQRLGGGRMSMALQEGWGSAEDHTAG